MVELIRDTTFCADGNPVRDLPSDAIYLYCAFEGTVLNGFIVDGVILGCYFTKADLYWAFFNTARVDHTTFEECSFEGASFRDADFVQCTFRRCTFGRDNLGGLCTFADCRFVECTFEECELELDGNPRPNPVFEANRFYGCRQERPRRSAFPF